MCSAGLVMSTGEAAMPAGGAAIRTGEGVMPAAEAATCAVSRVGALWLVGGSGGCGGTRRRRSADCFFSLLPYPSPKLRWHNSGTESMKKLLYLLTCLLVLSSFPILAVAAGPTVVVVRTFESQSSIRVCISRGAATPEIVEFPGGDDERKSASSAVGYQLVIAKLYAQGYVLQSTFAGATYGSTTSNTLVFVKATKP